MEKWLIVAFIITIFVVLILQMVFANHNRRKRWKAKFRKDWGTVPQREYDYTELEKISRYFYYKLNKGQIQKTYVDDITWNDLDMDSIFAYANHAKSSPGEEYLYYLLRTPVTEQSVLDERERLMQFFASDENARLKLELCFAEIGKTRKFAVSDYVDNLLELKKENNFLHYLALFSAPIAIAMMFGMSTGSLPLILLLLIWDVVSYYKRKSEIEPYLTTFSHIMKMLDASKELSDLKIEEVSEYTKRIQEARKKFRKFRFGSSILMSGKGATGDLMDVLMDYVRMVTHIDLLKFNSMLEEVKKNVGEIDVLVENIGMLDAMISAASFRESLTLYCVPDLKKEKKAFVDIRNIYHPLIENPVANSICEDRSVLITGSNASGKSTFLKTVAINAVLAQSLNTCVASSYRASFFQIYSSMALKDNLQGSESYYIVEIKSLKRILSHADDELPMLCFVDEVLRGTNTVERISASAQILKSLVNKSVICFAATHDIELTHMLEDDYSNYHFQEEIQENDVLFNYQLFKGRAVSRNAIKLLSIIGYESEIIEKAEKTAAHFLDTGEWAL